MTALTAAEARIALLEAELETYKMYKSERDSLERAYDKAEQDRNHWHDKAQEYRQQSVEYRKSRDKWCEVAVRDQLSSRDTLPRVITADELKLGSGQWIAYKSYTHDDLWIAEKYDMDAFSPGYNGTIVLLADAPDTKDINVAKETVKGEYPDNPWFSTVYEDAPYLAGTWRGTPVRPQSIRTGDLYDIHTAHGSRITGVVAARNGVRNPQNGDMYRLITRKA